MDPSYFEDRAVPVYGTRKDLFSFSTSQFTISDKIDACNAYYGGGCYYSYVDPNLWLYDYNGSSCHYVISWTWYEGWYTNVPTLADSLQIFCSGVKRYLTYRVTNGGIVDWTYQSGINEDAAELAGILQRVYEEDIGALNPAEFERALGILSSQLGITVDIPFPGEGEGEEEEIEEIILGGIRGPWYASTVMFKLLLQLAEAANEEARNNQILFHYTTKDSANLIEGSSTLMSNNPQGIFMTNSSYPVGVFADNRLALCKYIEAAIVIRGANVTFNSVFVPAEPKLCLPGEWDAGVTKPGGGLEITGNTGITIDPAAILRFPYNYEIIQ